LAGYLNSVVGNVAGVSNGEIQNIETEEWRKAGDLSKSLHSDWLL